MFNPEELTSIPEFEIPPKCEDCGVVCDLKKKLTALLINKHIVNHVGESLMSNGQEFDEMIDENIPLEMADEVKKQLRSSVVEGLDNIDENIESIQADINANTLACDGILKMRATKGDATYIVGVCTSPRAYLRDSGIPKHVSSHVEVRSANK